MNFLLQDSSAYAEPSSNSPGSSLQLLRDRYVQIVVFQLTILLPLLQRQTYLTQSVDFIVMQPIIHISLYSMKEQLKIMFDKNCNKPLIWILLAALTILLFIWWWKRPAQTSRESSTDGILGYPLLDSTLDFYAADSHALIQHLSQPPAPPGSCSLGQVDYQSNVLLRTSGQAAAEADRMQEQGNKHKSKFDLPKINKSSRRNSFPHDASIRLCTDHTEKFQSEAGDEIWLRRTLVFGDHPTDYLPYDV